MGLEDEVKGIRDEHAGMISKEAARGILEKRKKQHRVRIQDLVSGGLEGESVSIEEQVYRVFNKVRFTKENRERLRRRMVLGSPSSSILITLWDKYAEMADLLPIERGDRILIENARLIKGRYGTELSSVPNTYIARLSTSHTAVSDFSTLKPGERETDLVGRVTSVGSIRYFKTLSGKESSVAEVTITDGKKEARLTLWGSSSAAIAEIPINGIVKVEFARVRPAETGIELRAEDDSRILVKKNTR